MSLNENLGDKKCFQKSVCSCNLIKYPAGVRLLLCLNCTLPTPNAYMKNMHIQHSAQFLGPHFQCQKKRTEKLQKITSTRSFRWQQQTAICIIMYLYCNGVIPLVAFLNPTRLTLHLVVLTLLRLDIPYIPK